MKRRIAISALVFFWSLFFVSLGWATKSFLVTGDKVSVDPNSPFVNRLSVGQAKTSHGPRILKLVAQIIALSNASGSLVKSEEVSWAQLDADLSKSVGLNLPGRGGAKAGQAIGLLSVPSLYSRDLSVGDHLKISRYGTNKTQIAATIISIRTGTEAGGALDPEAPAKVLFKVSSGQTWYPGTNCEVEMVIHSGQSARVAMSSILHASGKDYLFQETAPNQFAPRDVWVISEGNGVAEVLGDVKPGDRILETGSILLKPVLRELIAARPEAGDLQKK